MTKEQQRVDSDANSAEKVVRAGSNPKDREDVPEQTGKLAVSKKDLAVANAGSSSAPAKVETNTFTLEKLDNLRPSHWLRPIQARLPQLGMLWGAESRSLRVDVVSHDDDLVVRVDVAGITKDRLDVAVTSDTLTVRSTAPDRDADASYHHRELPHGELERRIALPCEVQGDKASATVRNGLLEVVLPKSEKSRFQKVVVN